jgi:tetratricopeptide (TPR) repeat protein
MLRPKSRIFDNSHQKTNTQVWKEKNSELISLINSKEIDQAMTLGQELLKFTEKKFQGNSKEKATTYNNMGMVFLLARDYELAEKCFREALEMRKRIFGKQHNEVAIIFMNLVQLYRVQADEIFLINRIETE